METTGAKPNTQFLIRCIKLEDYNAIREVATQTWEVTYSATVRSTNRERILTQSYSESSFRRTLSRVGLDTWFLVAEVEMDPRQVIGFGQVILGPGAFPEAELTRIYILPEWQNRGVGKALLENLLALLREIPPELRPPRLRLSVQTHNFQAKNFYERRGFKYQRDFTANLPGQLLEMQEYILEI